MLIVMAGLPGAGKSAVADALGRVLPVPVLSVDPIEAAMLGAGVDRSQPTGLAAYVVADVLARHLLGLGQDVLVDAVNGVEVARRQWRAIAARHGVPLRIIEVICSDREVHRQRLESRYRGIPGFPEPTWAEVQLRRAEYEPWTDPRLVLDSVGDHAANVDLALAYLAGEPLPDRTRDG